MMQRRALLHYLYSTVVDTYSYMLSMHACVHGGSSPGTANHAAAGRSVRVPSRVHQSHSMQYSTVRALGAILSLSLMTGRKEASALQCNDGCFHFRPAGRTQQSNPESESEWHGHGVAYHNHNHAATLPRTA
jgi:hypothetical protein